MNDDVRFQNPENYESSGYNKEITFASIVLNYLNRIGILFACEFRGGYYKAVETKKGHTEIYVEDTRETLCNAIHFLYTLLSPHFDDTMLEASKIFDKKIKENQINFINKSSPEEEIILGDSFYENDKDRIYLESYKQTKLSLYLKVFAYLSAFLKRNHYMATEMAIDEV